MSDYTKAKGFLKAINDLKIKGLSKVKYIGLKKDAMLEKFLETVEAIDDLGKLDELPEDIVAFYEAQVPDDEADEVEDDEVEEEEDDEVEDDDDDYEDVDDDEVEDDEEEDDIEDEEDEEDEEEEASDEPEFETMSKKDLIAFAKENDLTIKGASKKPLKKLRQLVADAYDEAMDEEDEEEPEPKKPAKKTKGKKEAPKAKPEKKAKAKKAKADDDAEPKKRKVKATTRMSAKINEGVLTLQYGDEKKKLKVQNEDKAKLKATIKKATEWAKEVGATHGQVQAVKKSFTTNGYHVTR